jgi:hypothetical protein
MVAIINSLIFFKIILPPVSKSITPRHLQSRV